MAQDQIAQASKANSRIDRALSPVVLTPGKIIEGTRGTQKGRYTVEKYLGEGWTAVVYLGTDVDDPGQKVALKVLRPGSSDITVSSFRGEVQIISSIRNQGITCVPQIYGLFKGDPYEFIAMELISDEEYPRLDHLLALKGPLPEADALGIACQALTLLDRLHTQVGRTYTDMQLKDFCWNTNDQKLMVLDWNHVSFERDVIEDGLKNNTPSILEQLRNRGDAKNFDDLVRLDVLRFAAFFYELLTGKHARETGETIWSLKTRAGERWEALSESVRSILVKALVEYPGAEHFKTADAMLSAVESFLALREDKDLDSLRDRLGEILDQIDDRDEAESKGPRSPGWMAERQDLISQAAALFSHIRGLPPSQDTDPNFQKWMDRQLERIRTLTEDVSPAWGTGQRHFGRGEYLAALEVWRPEAERQGIPRLWRYILLAQTATETDQFSLMRKYLYITPGERAAPGENGALNLLEAGDIDQALTRFRSGVAGLLNLMGSLAMVETELSSLQLIKQANQEPPRALDNLKRVVHLLNDAPLGYQNILLRDPLWYSLVGPWLSEDQKNRFRESGEADIVALVGSRIRSLEEQREIIATTNESRAETEQFIMDIIRRRKSLEDLRDRLWAQPEDVILPLTLLTLLEERLPSLMGTIKMILDGVASKEAAVEKSASLVQLLNDLDAMGFFDPVMGMFQISANKKQLHAKLRANMQELYSMLQQMGGMVLKWGANPADLEERLRSQYVSLTASLYVVQLTTAVADSNWDVAKQVARNICWLKGSQAAEMEFVSRLADEFKNELKDAQRDLKKKQLVAALASEDRLKHLARILDILNVPNPYQRQAEILEISDEVGSLSEQRQELEGVTYRLEGMSALSELMETFLKDLSQEIGAVDDSRCIDYQWLGDKAGSHLQTIKENYPDWADDPQFKDWMASLERYQKLSEETMKQRQQYVEFMDYLNQCAGAIGKRDHENVQPLWASANQRYINLRLDGKEKTWLDDLQSAIREMQDFDFKYKQIQTELGEFINQLGASYGTDRPLQNAGLRSARQTCKELLQMQEKYAAAFHEFAPGFTFKDLDELDRRIQLWEQLLPFARTLEENKRPVLIVKAGEEIESKAAPSDEKKEAPQPGTEHPNRRKVVAWLLSGIVLLSLIAVVVWQRSTLMNLLPGVTLRPSATQATATIPPATKPPTGEPSAAPVGPLSTKGTVIATTVSPTSALTSIVTSTPTAMTSAPVGLTGFTTTYLYLYFIPQGKAKDTDKTLLLNGASFTAVGRNKDATWLQIYYENKCGWISADYVTKNNWGSLPEVDENLCLPPAATSTPSNTPTSTPTATGILTVTPKP